MCSIEEPVMIRDEQLSLFPSDKSFICVKCKSNSSTIAIRQTVNCTDCFLKGFSLKFRTLCAKNRKSKSSEKILLCFSGGLSSRALVHVAAEPFRTDPDRLGLHEYTVLYLNEGHYNENEIQTYLSSYPFPFIIQQISAEEKERLDQCNPTQREDYLAIIRRGMFVQTAKELGCSLIYTGDNSTRTAIKIIDFTGKGRGFTLPFEVGRDDLHLADASLPTSIVRPLMEHTSKEVAFYCYHNRLLGTEPEELNLLKTQTQTATKDSLQTITEHFIVALERDYSSTVSTVSKTATKFTTSITTLSESLQLPRCVYCAMPIPEGIDEWYKGTTIFNPLTTNEERLATSSDNSNQSRCCYPCRVAKFPWKPDNQPKMQD